MPPHNKSELTHQPELPSHRSELTIAELAQIMQVVMRFGTLMLRCGTVSFRVEEAMRQVAMTLGVERLDAFTTLTGITASAHCGALHYTQVARIYSIGVNMSRLSEVEFLSQHIPADATPSSLMATLDKIESHPSLYSPPLTVMAVAIACGAFSGLNGGGTAEFMAATAAAGIGQWVRMRINRRYLNPIAITVVCAAIATLLCNFALKSLIWLGLESQTQDSAFLAAVLFLVPGMPLVTAALDLVRLDLLSGMSRVMYALLLLAGGAFGMMLGMSLVGLSLT
ncbi:MAG: threonine/serine exporter family protein [Drouetiella hepatica Uher 2000/2452]|jgi:uncharacterized membrane protein YjjP (DUF1212 family)|uniref:Threonine/serine exporter family protein n=1 Tax=Drouetiella hepatica Uher 2000/2452 TaxID=904376 RepID=A0A951QH03_9CYAN|nr:threonine/serine exporter family protein [Drouetiella hepatica Uher 2000/2452]